MDSIFWTNPSSIMTVGYMGREERKNFFYGFLIFTGDVFIDLALSGLQADMKPGSISRTAYTDQIGLQYIMILKIYLYRCNCLPFFSFKISALVWPLFELDSLLYRPGGAYNQPSII
jgi:hypothetical protein